MENRVIKVPTSGFNPLLQSEFSNSPSDDCYIVILSSRDKTLIRKGLQPLRWATRYGEYLNGNELFRVTDNKEVLSAIDELEVKIMGCDISNSLNNIAKAIELLAKSQCCNSTDVIVNVNGGINGSLPDGTITYGTESYGSEAVTLPDGYTSEAQYKAQKCALANAMADGIIGVVYGLDGIAAFEAIAGTTIAVLGLFSVIAVPEVAIPALLAAVAVAWLVSGSLFAVAQEIENRRDELVCILYNTDTPSTAISLVADFFDTVIAFLALTSPVGIAVKTILMILVNETTLSKLYDEYAGFMYPSANCDDCNPIALAEFNQAMGHRDIWGGQEYGATQENVELAYGDIDGLKAHFNGSYYLDVSYAMSKMVSAGTQIYLTYELLHSSIVGVYTNENATAFYTSGGWVQQTLNGNSFVASNNFRSVLIKVYGDSGYNSDILLDAVTG